MKPIAIDLCCGLGGWTQGLLSEGYDVIGFDIERHEYGDKRYPAQLILKSILEINGYDLRAVNPALVVASPPCQNYSYMAMPWSRAKAMAARIRASEAEQVELNALFNACFRIAREIGCPIVLENVKGAQPWVGPANAHYGSYYLWGDVGNVGGRVVRADQPAKFGEYVRPAAAQKFNPDGTKHGQGSWFAIADSKQRGVKCRGNDTFAITGNPCGKLTNPRYPSRERESDGVKMGGSGDEYWRKPLEAKRREATAIKNGGDWFASGDDCSLQRRASSKSSSRKAASAMIAEIPFDLARHIAKVFKPR